MEYKWKLLRDDIARICFNKYKKIYITNDIVDKNMLDKLSKSMSCELITYQTIDDDCLVICQDKLTVNYNCKIMSVDEVYYSCVSKQLSPHMFNVSIDDYWDAINIKQIKDYKAIVEVFDKWNISVPIISDSEEYYGLITKGAFKDGLLSDNIIINKEAILLPEKNNIKQKKNFFCKMFGQGVGAMPVIDDKHISAMVRFNGYYYGNGIVTLADFIDKIKFKWENISDEIAKKIFPKGCKILLSSYVTDRMKGFYDRFNNLWDITIFSNGSIGKIKENYYDVLIYDVDIWPSITKTRYDVWRIYIILLYHELCSFWKSHNINFMVIDCGIGNVGLGVINHEKRLFKQNLNISQNCVMHPVECGDYWIPEDYESNECNFKDGYRKTVNSNNCSKNKIYCIGPCAALGILVDDENTFSSWLQYYINEYNNTNNLKYDYSVINFGDRGAGAYSIFSDIISLKKIANTKLNKGDIVIWFSNGMLEHQLMTATSYIRMVDILNNENMVDIKCYSPDRNVGHINGLGYKAIAKEIFSSMISKGFFYNSYGDITFNEYKKRCNKSCHTSVDHYLNLEHNKNGYDNYKTARFDIVLNSNDSADFFIKYISDENAHKATPAWLQHVGKGFCIISEAMYIDIELEIITSGSLNISLLGPQIMDGNDWGTYWIDFSKFDYNDIVVFNDVRPVWFLSPFKYSNSVNAGEVVKLHFEWRPHIDTRRKLIDVMNNSQKYIEGQYEKKENINKLNSYINSISYYVTSRMDIGILGIKENSFEIIDCSDVNIEENILKETVEHTYVKSIESLSLKLNFKLKILFTGKLIINFRGKEVKNEDGKLMPHWIDYKKIRINDKMLLDQTFPAWYNVPINLSGLVRKGEIINLHVEWAPHIDNRTVIE